MSRYPKAIIFDLDGVITDTAKFHFVAWKEIAKELGLSIDYEINEKLKGISRMESLEVIISLDPTLSTMSEQEKFNYTNQKNDYYKTLIETINPDHILPSITDLLEEIKRNNIKIALGSASRNAPAIIKQLELSNYFDYCVDVSKVTNGKPDPEIFTTAAKGLFVPTVDCIGIEDAVSGVEAINSANMFSVGVGSTEQLSKADYIVENTVELEFEEIVKHYVTWKRSINKHNN